MARKKKEHPENSASALAKDPSPTIFWTRTSTRTTPSRRRLVVFAMGALDDLRRPGQGAARGETPRRLGHGGAAPCGTGSAAGPARTSPVPGPDQGREDEPVQAETVLQLLHSFGEEDLTQPETVPDPDRLPGPRAAGLRGLAHWHLVRLVPAGQKIGYNPLGSRKEAREAACASGRPTGPPGEIPSRVGPDDDRPELARLVRRRESRGGEPEGAFSHNLGP